MIIFHLLGQNRMKWVKKDIKECIFCKIVKGEKDVKSYVIYKDNIIMVLLNPFPYNTGHIEVMPTRHVTCIEDLSNEEYEKLFLMIRKCIKLLKKTLKPIGFNVGINIGKNVAGASIDHIHFHIVPRYKRDFGFMEVVANTKVLPESIDKTFKRLMKFSSLLKID